MENEPTGVKVVQSQDRIKAALVKDLVQNTEESPQEIKEHIISSALDDATEGMLKIQRSIDMLEIIKPATHHKTLVVNIGKLIEEIEALR